MKLYCPITIDLYKVYPLQVMEAQQGNVGRGAIVTLTAGSAVIDPTDETVEVYAKKPDGTVSWLECSVEDGKIKIDFTNQMLMSPGILQVELRMKDDEDDITTPIFKVKVNKSNVQSAGRSENELPLLDQIKKNAEDAKAAAEAVEKELSQIIHASKYGIVSDGFSDTVIVIGKDAAAGDVIKYVIEENSGDITVIYDNNDTGEFNITTIDHAGEAAGEKTLTAEKYCTYTFPSEMDVYLPFNIPAKTSQLTDDVGFAKQEEVGKLSEEKVSNPSTGEVGQILEIETVDEKGKPKTYKAVNKPTGGEVSEEQIAEAVENYLTENPIEGGGADGIGIQSVEQTTTSTEDGGTNIITVTKTDGTSSTFKVLNGSKGSQGEKGEQGEKGDKGEKGDTGSTGATGKTAYQYAQDGGYTGTESEFAEKLATENPNEIMVIVESELSDMTQEELSDKYKNGTRVLAVTDNYENIVPMSISPNGKIYNGCGYLSGYRLNSSGGISESENSAMTGFIPYIHGKTIHIIGGLQSASFGGQYVNTYDENFELTSMNYLDSIVTYSNGTSIFNNENVREDIINTAEITDNSIKNIFEVSKYIRVSLNPCIGKDMVVYYE